MDRSKEQAEKAQDVVAKAVEKYNATLLKANQELEDAINEYNGIVNKVAGKLEDLHREKQEAYDNSSDRFKESDEGDAANRWLSDLEAVVQQAQELEVRLALPSELSVEFDPTLETVLDELQTEAQL